MKILLIILIITIAINRITKHIFESNFADDLIGIKRLKYQLSNKIYFSNVVYSISKIMIFIELIIIAIKFIFIVF